MLEVLSSLAHELSGLIYANLTLVIHYHIHFKTQVLSTAVRSKLRIMSFSFSFYTVFLIPCNVEIEIPLWQKIVSVNIGRFRKTLDYFP